MEAFCSYGGKQKQMYDTVIKQFTEMRISFISTYTKLHYSFLKEQHKGK